MLIKILAFFFFIYIEKNKTRQMIHIKSQAIFSEKYLPGLLTYSQPPRQIVS